MSESCLACGRLPESPGFHVWCKCSDEDKTIARLTRERDEYKTEAANAYAQLGAAMSRLAAAERVVEACRVRKVGAEWRAIADCIAAYDESKGKGG
jgi:hypothetical protein